MSKKFIIGAGMIIAAILFFILDYLAIDNTYIALLALLGLITSITTGRSLAYLIHDSDSVKKLGKRDFPTTIFVLWLSVWFAFLIFYTIVMIIFKIGSTSLVASFTGKFTGLITILLGLGGSYLFFKARSDKHPEKMYTRWGKMAHKSVKLMRMPEMIQKASVTTGARMVKGGTETFQTGKNMAEDTMKTFENLWKKEKR